MSRTHKTRPHGPKPAEPGLATRKLAAETLAGVLAGQPFTPIGAAQLADSRDRAFANRLVTTALRRNGHLDTIIAALLERGLPKRAGLFAPLLYIGLCELLFIEGAAAHAAIDSAVTLLKADRRGGHLAKLLNATLRSAQRRSEEFTALPPETLIPEPFRSAWRQLYGEDALLRFAEALVAGAPLDLSFKTDDPTLVDELQARPTLPPSARIETRDRIVGELPGYDAGAWWVQDVAATVPARLIDLPAGARVLDLCAAPGGKTAQLCAAGYTVTALDNDQTRLARLEANLARLGYGAEIICADAAEPLDLAPFDAILIDAPCSATGTFRRHPEVLINRRQKDIADRVGLQRRIVANAVPLLKPGGQLVFATCSLEPAEGEEQADWIARAFPNLTATALKPAERQMLAPALTSTARLRTHPGLVWPELGPGGMDGFFVARFINSS